MTMNGITWRHVTLIGLGVSTVIFGALPIVTAGAATALIAVGSSIITGAFGHAQGANKNKREEG